MICKNNTKNSEILRSMCFIGLLLAKIGRMLAGWVDVNLTKYVGEGDTTI